MKGLKFYIILTQIVLFSFFNVVLSNSTINKPLLAIRDSNFNLNTSDWSNATVISDDSNAWNTGNGYHNSIAIDNNGNVHVVWYDNTVGAWGGGPSDTEIMYVNYTSAGWSNATVISDLYGWNDGLSERPQISIDGNNVIHVIWQDNTAGEWGIDYEIMYVKYNDSTWSNATVISDDYTGWNDASSYNSHIAVDKNNVIHVVWQDDTDGVWGGGSADAEIMYINNTGAGWTNATVISDDYTGWNTADSNNPRIVVDNNSRIHVVWEDKTDGIWGSDDEIMYANYTGSSWSNATVISDDYTNWNIGESISPSIAVDSNDAIHVVWQDWTNGEWGNDREIMYTNYAGASWSNATVVSDDYTGWNTDPSRDPSIAIGNDNTIHVVWQDDTDGEWGTDAEILYVTYTGSEWSSVSCISDVYGWNDGSCNRPRIAIGNNGIIHVVWEDTTAGEWGGGPTDWETMYTGSFIPKPSEPTDLGLLILLLSPEADSLPLILSLVLVGTALAIVILVIYIKNMKK